MGIFDAFEKAAIKSGIWIPDTKEAPVTKQDDSIKNTTSQILPLQTPSFSQDSQIPDENIFNAILQNINNSVKDNKVKILLDTAEKMKVKIQDEGMRLQGAAAVCGLTSDDLFLTLKQLEDSLHVEVSNFTVNEIPRMENEVKNMQNNLEETKATIEDLTNQLEEASKKQTELMQLISSKQSENNTTVNIFKATAEKVHDYLTQISKKVTIYIQEGTK